MAKLSEDKINEIRNRADIVEVLGQYVQLHKAGRSYKCICPFHDDHSPSMNISKDKQIYKCFACGEGGNVFTFVRKIENISYLESVYKVAGMVGIELEQSLVLPTKSVDPFHAAMYAALHDASEFCAYQLDSIIGMEQREYLKKRGIHDELRHRFGFGFNPGGDALYKFLHAKKHTDEVLIQSGLCMMNASGMHDIFENRLMIPIHDPQGKVIAFTARRVREDQVKYINTAQTPLYHKGNTVFNYHRVKEKLRSFQQVYLVEGAMDVISFAKAGLDNAVAMLGTAITKDQLLLLKRLGIGITLFYDGDDAGVAATYKFSKLANEHGLNFEIVDNRSGMDADEIIEAYGLDEFKARLKKTISWIDFLFMYLQRRYDLQNHSQRKAFAEEIVKEIHAISDGFEKDSYYIRLRELTGYDMQQRVVKPSNNNYKEKRQQKNYIVYPKTKTLHSEYAVLSQMLISRHAATYFKNELGVLLTPTCNKLALYIIDEYRNATELSVAKLLDVIKEDDVKELLLNISEWDLASDELKMDVLAETIETLKLCYHEEKIRRLNVLIAQTNDPLLKAKYADEKITYIKQRSEMLNKDKKQES